MGASKHEHEMPFGARILAEGRVRFRIWAPDRESLSLVVHPGTNRESIQAMGRLEDGWFELVTETAGAGDLYQYRLEDGFRIPDPASRFQPQGVHGPSQVVDAGAFSWSDGSWKGRPWTECVLYELHVGAFTGDGTFSAVRRHLDRLATLGVTAVELMPVASFPGRRNWGYDGVKIFAPARAYGRPEDLKALVQAAHERGLMVFLDVVYNHFGPEGNYLHLYASPFFTSRRRTPWGDAIDFHGEQSGPVREFFIHNALYWLEEYRMDGLRLDAVHAIHDPSSPHILEELADRVRRGPGRDRHVHLVLENDRNEAHYLDRGAGGPARRYEAQWNDDIHHALHCRLTGESGGYYQDYSGDSIGHLARCLTEGFAYQGEPSVHRGGEQRGESSRFLPPDAFVSFLQNHDQIGNRAMGERLTVLTGRRPLRAAAALLLAAPSIPLIFMGEEFGCRSPFPFFSDFGPDLASAVTEGRRREFASFPEFSDPEKAARFPDPQDSATFEQAVLDWGEAESAEGMEWTAFYQAILEIRRKEVIPRISGTKGGSGRYRRLGLQALRVEWMLGDGSRLSVLANLGDEPERAERPPGRCLGGSELPDRLTPGLEWTETASRDRPIRGLDWAEAANRDGGGRTVGGELPPWTVLWFLDDRREGDS